LFDGEGHIQYKQYMRQRTHNKKPYPTWSIRIEIAMTEQSLLIWVCEALNTGTVRPRKVKPGRKKQWRWRCSHRQAYYVALLLWPYVHIKIEDIRKIIEHYTDRGLVNGNVIDLKKYKEVMSLE
tara:strand:+ start:560 stop:931 length:372 start_codon:yes stop_codon:yes gene_type:complete